MPHPIYTIESADLGDNLFVTPVLRARRGATIQMRDCPRSRNTANIYDMIGSTAFSSDARTQVKWWHPDEHKAVRILREVGLSGADPLPFVELSQAELVAAAQVVLPFTRPILVSLSVRVPDTEVGRYRSPTPEMAQSIVTTLIEAGYQPVLLCREGPSPTARLSGVTYLEGIPLRVMLACSQLIGRYCGVDSGPLHAMLAVGGKVLGLVPQSHDTLLPHGCYLWSGDAIWRGRKPRASYLTFDQIGKLRDRLSFLA